MLGLIHLIVKKLNYGKRSSGCRQEIIEKCPTIIILVFQGWKINIIETNGTWA